MSRRKKGSNLSTDCHATENRSNSVATFRATLGRAFTQGCSVRPVHGHIAISPIRRHDRSVLRLHSWYWQIRGRRLGASIGAKSSGSDERFPSLRTGQGRSGASPHQSGPRSTQRQSAICYLLFVIPAEPKARPASRPLDAKCGDRGRSQDA
jgi:hypothetical protein